MNATNRSMRSIFEIMEVSKIGWNGKEFKNIMSSIQKKEETR